MIDLREVKRIQAKAAGKEPPTFRGPFMFYYVVFTFVENNQYQILTEVQAKEKLLRYPKMETFLLKFPKSETPVPAIIKNRRGLQTEPCTSFEKASEIIYLKTGLKIHESELMNKTKMKMKDTRPLVDQVRDLKKSNHDRIVNLFECSAMAEAKKRMSIKNAKCKY